MDRTNPELDAFMAGTEPKRTKRRKARTVKVARDQVKRRAFRVLAVLSDLDAAQRERVLKMAAKLSAA